MRGADRFFTLGAFVYMAVYIQSFLLFPWGLDPRDAFAVLVPFHLLCMLLNLLALVLTIRDLYLRRFDAENAKLTWLLLILCTGGIGWLVYVFKHGLKPRGNSAEDPRAEAGGKRFT